MLKILNEQYPDADTAFRMFAHNLRCSGYSINSISPRNMMRHRLIKTRSIDFYCLFKRGGAKNGPFKAFSKYFSNFATKYPSYSSHGESINKDIIISICSDNHNPNSEKFIKEIVLVYIYSDASSYICNPLLFKRYAEKFKLIRDHDSYDFRKGTSGKYENIKETTYHLPFAEPFFINFNKWVIDKNDN